MPNRNQSATIDLDCLPATQGGAKKRKFRGARQGLPPSDMLGDKEGGNSALKWFAGIHPDDKTWQTREC